MGAGALGGLWPIGPGGADKIEDRFDDALANRHGAHHALHGKQSRRIQHLPERSFLYLLHAIRDEKRGPANILTSRDWRLYLMHPADVERELLRLHQFKKLDYQVAGSLVQLSLPCRSPQEFAERLVA